MFKCFRFLQNIQEVEEVNTIASTFDKYIQYQSNQDNWTNDTLLNSTPKILFFRSIFTLENILILNKTDFSVLFKSVQIITVNSVQIKV